MDEATAVPLVVPTFEQLRAPAVWVTIANWADGLADRFGSAAIVTPSGELSSEDARRVGRQASPPGQPSRPRRPVEVVTRTLAKDIRHAWWGVDFGTRGLPALAGPPPLVWQHHDLFQVAGLRLARRNGVPFVLFVDAPQVWEASNWGVRRPGWGRLLERLGEVPQLTRADVVACVSEEVHEAACALGARADRTIVTPCTAPARMPRVDRSAARRALGVEDAFVVGWVGSFRAFHGVDVLAEALRPARDTAGRRTVLVLVGDGARRHEVERRCAAYGLEVRCTGNVAHDEVFEHMSAFDCGVVTAAPATAFHYSPLKLKEYLAAGIPVVAPAVGEMARALTHGEDALLYDVADAKGLRAQIDLLADAPELGARLAANGRVLCDREFSIGRQVDEVAAMLADGTRR